MRNARAVADFLGLRGDVVALLTAMIVIGCGEELWIRFVPKYLDVLGAGTLAIGVYDGLKTLLGALYAYPGGILTDRWGHRKALVLFTSLSIIGYLIVFAIPHWPAVLGATFLFLSWSSFSLPATFSLVGKNLAPEKYGMGIAVQAIVKRVPIVIGPVLGGLLIDRLGFRGGMRVALVVSSLLGAATVLIQLRISEDEISSFQSASWRRGPRIGDFRPELRHLLLSDILVRFCERIPFA